MATTTRVCSVCNQTKSITSYYLSRGTPMRHCKACHYAKMKTYARTPAGRERARLKSRATYRATVETPEGRAKLVASNRKAQEAYRASHQEEARARDRVRSLVRRGHIGRPDVCPYCSSPSSLPMEAHHYDYARPLLFDWLCKECHGVIHREYSLGFPSKEAYLREAVLLARSIKPYVDPSHTLLALAEPIRESLLWGVGKARIMQPEAEELAQKEASNEEPVLCSQDDEESNHTMPWLDAANWLAQRQCLEEYVQQGHPTGRPVMMASLYTYYDSTY